jgi:hypothetical protein
MFGGSLATSKQGVFLKEVLVCEVSCCVVKFGLVIAK